MFTQVIIRKRKKDGWTDGRTTDGHTEVQSETIIPHHYCVAGFGKGVWYFMKVSLLETIYMEYQILFSG